LLPATWRIALQQRDAHGNYSGTTTLTAAVFESRHRLKNRRSHFCQSVVPLLSHSDISAEGWQKNADSGWQKVEYIFAQWK
jgi:hypothetical protein